MKILSLFFILFMTIIGNAGAVGSYELRLEKGFNLIACQLMMGNNLLSDIYPDAPEGTMVYMYDPTKGYMLSIYEDNEWSTNLFVPPASGYWVRLPYAVTNYYFGTIVQGKLITPLYAGYNLLGSMVPTEGYLQKDLAYVPNDGDMIYKYNPETGYTTYTYDSNEWIPEEPYMNVGEGFWIRTLNDGYWIRDYFLKP